MRDVDQIIQSMAKIFPAVKVEQLRVLHPGADDDGLWFFGEPGKNFDVQIESATGMGPFLIETSENDTRLTASAVEETIEILAKLLHLERHP